MGRDRKNAGAAGCIAFEARRLVLREKIQLPPRNIEPDPSGRVILERLSRIAVDAREMP
jgi:hypothetical protein